MSSISSFVVTCLRSHLPMCHIDNLPKRAVFLIESFARFENSIPKCIKKAIRDMCSRNIFYPFFMLMECTETSKKINYKHLRLPQRMMIQVLHKEGKTQKYIAREIGCKQSTISRELSRNLVENGHGREVYRGEKADTLCKTRRDKANQQHNLYMKYKLLPCVLAESLVSFSPDVLANRILKEQGYKISTATIYNYITYVRPELRKKLLFKGGYKKRGSKKRARICPDIPRIHDRGDEANERKEIGHREADSVVSLGHRGGITTLTDRMSRYLILKRSQRLDASTTLMNMIDMLANKPLSTITSDNGSEFAFLDVFARKMNCEAFLCDPYSSRQKGSNERNNREIRVFAPKGTDFNLYSDKQLQDIEDKINHMPRKSLGYKSAFEVFYNTTRCYRT